MLLVQGSIPCQGPHPAQGSHPTASWAPAEAAPSKVCPERSRQSLLQEHAGLQLVGRWQSPPAAPRSSFGGTGRTTGGAGGIFSRLRCPALVVLAIRVATELQFVVLWFIWFGFTAALPEAEALLSCSFWSICGAPLWKGLLVFSLSIKVLHHLGVSKCPS